MSVASTTNKVQYTITGLPQVLTVNFVFDLDTDLLVLDGNTVLTNASDYSLTTGGSGATGTITVVGTGAHAVQVNDVVTIMRNVPLTQLTSFDSTGVLTAAMIESGFDKLTEIDQQETEVLSRCLRFEPDENLSGMLPLASRKGMFLAFDATTGAPVFLAGNVIPSSITLPMMSPVLMQGSYVYDNYFIFGAGNATMTGPGNVGIGVECLNFDTTGEYNTALGFAPLYRNTTGNNNTAIGNNALNANISGNNNTAVGNQALMFNTTSYNTAVGTYACDLNTTGINNTALGTDASYYNLTGNNNVAVGRGALNHSLTSGNTALGNRALFYQDAGMGNTAVGYTAGDNGNSALKSATNCTYVGYEAAADADAYTNSTALGSGSVITASNQMVFGDGNITSNVFSGTISTGNPSNGSGAWRMGTKRTSTGLGVSTTTGVQIMVGSDVLTLAVLTTNP